MCSMIETAEANQLMQMQLQQFGQTAVLMWWLVTVLDPCVHYPFSHPSVHYLYGLFFETGANLTFNKTPTYNSGSMQREPT